MLTVTPDHGMSHCLNSNNCDLPKQDASGRKICSAEAREKLPDTGISDGLRNRLKTVMPGVASYLDRYEYLKHGSCAEKVIGKQPPDMMTSEEYFEKAIYLVNKLNETSLREFVAANVGGGFSRQQLCAAIGKALGPEAIPAVEVSAKWWEASPGNFHYSLTELRIWLKSDKNGGLDLSPVHYQPVQAGGKTLGPAPADPLCEVNFYIDKPGMGQ